MLAAIASGEVALEVSANGGPPEEDDEKKQQPQKKQQPD
jgi:hypothetical protein